MKNYRDFCLLSKFSFKREIQAHFSLLPEFSVSRLLEPSKSSSGFFSDLCLNVFKVFPKIKSFEAAISGTGGDCPFLVRLSFVGSKSSSSLASGAGLSTSTVTMTGGPGLLRGDVLDFFAL